MMLTPSSEFLLTVLRPCYFCELHVSFDCCVALPRDAMGLSGVCDCLFF